MSFSILTIPPFDKQLKRLSKKYTSLKQDFADFLENLQAEPHQGIPLGKNCYKVRMSIASKGKGKSGGARIITTIVIEENTIFLLTIYDKSEKENLSDTEIKELLSYIEI